MEKFNNFFRIFYTLSLLNSSNTAKLKDNFVDLSTKSYGAYTA